MKMVIEYFVLFLFLLVFLWTGVMYVWQNIAVNNARSYNAAVVKEIENSHFSHMVIEECIDQAERDGYLLRVEDYTIYNESPIKHIMLTYTYSIPLINYTKDYTIEGFAG